MQQSTNNNELEETGEVSMGDLLYKFIPYWPFFVLLLIISMAGAWLYLRYRKPIYQTSAAILIKDDKKGGADNPLAAFDLFGSQKNLENEVEVLQSKTLMQEVVTNLDLYAAVTVEGRVLNQSGYLLSPVVIEAKNPDSLRFSNKIPFTYNADSQTVRVEKASYPLNQWVRTPFGMLQFIPNKYYHHLDKSNKDNNFHFYLTSIKNATNNILSQIKIAPSDKQSTVIDLSIAGEIPQRGEDILNELIKVYDHAAILDKNVLAANTLKFVEDRLKFVSNDLDSVERQLQNFKAHNRITDISAQGQIFLQNVAISDQKISDFNMQLAVLNQVENYVKSKEGMGGIVPATLGVGDPVLTELLQKLSALELQYTETKKLVPENNPEIIALIDGINKLKPGILENINNQRQNLMAGINNLEGTSSHYSSILQNIPEKERELLAISRQQAIKSNIYTFLLQKREETALSFASTVADSRIIDKAESSDSPIGPKKGFIYLIAIISAFVLGISLIIVKEMLTRSVQQRDDIEKYLDFPFLGEVNYDNSKAVFAITEGKRSFIAEQFRQLRTSLGYMGIDETHKKILITSSISGEGKSFIAINLGVSLALMGKKVILLELDLRKPKLSEQFNIARNVGLSTFLIGKTAPVDLLKKTSFENLFLITAGPIPPNPSELISNGKLAELFAFLEKKFDYILIDTAPVNPVTDAYILSPMADLTLFVVRHDFTPKLLLQKLAQRNRMNNLKNPALIYNGIRGRGVQRYGYGNGYGYGYGYTIEDNKKGWKNLFGLKKD